MGTSLFKTYSALGRILGETERGLYDKQRCFTFCGILDHKPGRGPGSGVPASPRTMAQFLIGLAMNASRPENVDFAKSIARAARPGYEPCELTGEIYFLDAFAKILGDSAIAARVREISLSISGLAFIKHDLPESIFLASDRKDSGGLQYGASIVGEDVRKIAKLVAEAE